MSPKEKRNNVRHLKSSKEFIHLGFCLLYSGLSFRGLQLQTHGPTHETVEGRLLQALNDIGIIEIQGGKPSTNAQLSRSCRTDRGVHAIRNLVSMYVPVSSVQNDVLSLDALAVRLNAHLPRAIRVAKISVLSNVFVPRHCCNRRVYRYMLPLYALLPSTDSWGSCAAHYPDFSSDLVKLHQQSMMDPTNSCHYVSLLNLGAASDSIPWLTSAAQAVERCNQLLNQYVVGPHRFHNFSVDLEVHGKIQHAKTIPPWSDEAVRCVHRCEVLPRLYFLPSEQCGPTLMDFQECSPPTEIVPRAPELSGLPNLPFAVFQIEGNSFLYNMIRKIVGTLIATARGMRVSVWEDLLCQTKRGSAPLAPGTYLYLALSTYHGYDRGLGEGSRYHTLQNEWSGTVAQAAESFAWKQIAQDVVDSDCNRVPSLDSLLLFRSEFLMQQRPGYASEDAHIREKPDSLSAGAAEVRYPMQSEMTMFLRSLRMHNWLWSDIKIPEGVSISVKGSTSTNSNSSKAATAPNSTNEAHLSCSGGLTVRNASTDHRVDTETEEAKEVVKGGEDGWLYLEEKMEAVLAEREAVFLKRWKRSRPWES